MVLAGRLCSKFLRSTINLSARRLHEVKYISVRDFYRNKNIFITGATGFLGQGLVENLLRSCPDLGNIYLPIRATKKGDTTRRYKKFLNNTVCTFDVKISTAKSDHERLCVKIRLHRVCSLMLDVHCPIKYFFYRRN